MVQNYNIKFIAQNIFAKSATLIYINVLSLYIHLLLYISSPYVALSPYYILNSPCNIPFGACCRGVVCVCGGLLFQIILKILSDAFMQMNTFVSHHVVSLARVCEEVRLCASRRAGVEEHE